MYAPLQGLGGMTRYVNLVRKWGQHSLKKRARSLLPRCQTRCLTGNKGGLRAHFAKLSSPEGRKLLSDDVTSDVRDTLAGPPHKLGEELSDYQHNDPGISQTSHASRRGKYFPLPPQRDTSTGQRITCLSATASKANHVPCLFTQL